MAQSPIKRDFTIKRRADFPLRLIFKDSNNTKVNLTGFTVAAEVYDEGRTKKFADFNVVYTDRPNGTIDLKLVDTDTVNFYLDKLSYDVKLTDPSGIQMYYLEGTLFINEGYTVWVHLILFL